MKFDNSTIRRQDRTLKQERAFEILKDGEYGILSMRTEDGEGAYGIPISYVWDRGNSIYIHCAPVGRKRFFLRGRTDTSEARTVHHRIRKRGVAMHRSS